MKRALVVLLTLLFASVAYGQESIWFDGTFDEAKVKAKNEGKLILIDFFAYG